MDPCPSLQDVKTLPSFLPSHLQLSSSSSSSVADPITPQELQQFRRFQQLQLLQQQQQWGSGVLLHRPSLAAVRHGAGQAGYHSPADRPPACPSSCSLLL
ncbi:hypothetical protein CLOP_g2155 [Closterium sp. NIES-67]|nr:hypothetical protein CLOP_g2155 [Closterium sp. NIES-67]